MEIGMVRKIDIEPGTDLTVQFRLVEEVVLPKPVVAPKAAAVQPPVEQGHGMTTRSWVLVGGSAATAVSLGIGIMYRVKAGSLDNDASGILAQIDDPSVTSSEVPPKQRCSNRTGAAQALCSQLHSTWLKRDTAANTSTAAFVSAGVL